MKDLFEFLKVNLRLVLGLCASVAGLIYVQLHVHTSAEVFLGVMDSKETSVSFETPVVVKRILVLPGERVTKGQPLIEVIPHEMNLKLLELQTELQVLESEHGVRSALLSGINSEKGLYDNSPIAKSIEGIQSQINELMRLKNMAVRFAEADGVVGSVAYREGESVPPFMPVITLLTESPDLVYGFLHENRASNFQVGQSVQIISLSDSNRLVEGQIVSLGSRITPLPDRYQEFGRGGNPSHYGREVIVRVPLANPMLAGEKVRIHSVKKSLPESLMFMTLADASQNEAQMDAQKLFPKLGMEVSGLAYVPESHELIIAADDYKKGGSPFWLIKAEKGATAKNLKMKGLDSIEDVEAVTALYDGNYVALSSLTSNGKKSKRERDLIIRFQLQGDSLVVDRALDLRTPLLRELSGIHLLQRTDLPLEEIEVESLSIKYGHGYLGLKQPRLLDGSSVIIKLLNLERLIEKNDLSSLVAEVYAIVKLNDSNCRESSRITDLYKTESGMLILGNCSKSEKRGQLWEISDSSSSSPELLFRINSSHPEGLALDEKSGAFYIGSDNGNKADSDITVFKLPGE